MKKMPICPYCHKIGHYGYACYQKNHILYRQRKRKQALKPLETASKAPLGPKTSRVSSSKKYEQSKRRKLIKELDKYTSLICRLGASDKLGVVTCYTCGKRDIWKNFDCGHYIKRSYQHTRWLQADVRPQCIACNRYKNGNYLVYEPKIKAELGEDEVLKLWDKAYDKRKIPTYELEEMLIKIKQDYKELINARREKGWVC